MNNITRSSLSPIEKSTYHSGPFDVWTVGFARTALPPHLALRFGEILPFVCCCLWGPLFWQLMEWTRCLCGSCFLSHPKVVESLSAWHLAACDVSLFCHWPVVVRLIPAPPSPTLLYHIDRQNAALMVWWLDGRKIELVSVGRSLFRSRSCLSRAEKAKCSNPGAVR